MAVTSRTAASYAAGRSATSRANSHAHAADGPGQGERVDDRAGPPLASDPADVAGGAADRPLADLVPQRPHLGVGTGLLFEQDEERKVAGVRGDERGGGRLGDGGHVVRVHAGHVLRGEERVAHPGREDPNTSSLDAKYT
ncbi:hypothetical protein [Streptomyces sp. KL116D]|uniref:hypothetical protein n=1 Tax=Streptomyces sp. KL116D TaxID=3045152 RepID=UPI0035580054